MCYASDNEPKRLSCSHTICEVCAQTILDTNIHGQGKQEINCPVCKVPTKVQGGSAASLPTNGLKKKIQDLYKEYPSIQSESVKCCICRIHINLSDIRYCQNCRRDMCVRCAAAHIQHVTFKNHIIESKMKICCKEHEDVCEYLCTMCDKFLCVACVQTGPCEAHQQDIKPIDSLKEELTFKIQNLQKKIKVIKEVESDSRNLELKREAVEKKLKKASDVKQQIIEHGEMLCLYINENVMKVIDSVNEWEAPLTKAEKRVNEKLAGKALEELERSIEDGLKGAVEEMIIVASLTECSLPGIITTREFDNLCTDIKFIPDESVNVGQVKIIKHSGKATSESTEQNIPRELCPRRRPLPFEQLSRIVTSRERKLPVILHKAELQLAEEVVFTPKGNIVVCDRGASNLVMYNREGDVITSSRDRGVEYEDKPRGISLDLNESAIIVTHDKDYLTYLSSEELTVKRRVYLEGCAEAIGVAMLSDGRLVVGDAQWPYSINIYDKDGIGQRRITHYEHYGEHELLRPWCIAVLPDDTIVVSIYSKNHIVYLTPDLQCLQVVDIQSPIGLTVTPQGDILVVCNSPHRICHLKGSPGSIQSDVAMQFSAKDIEEYGYLQSVAMKDNQLAVMFRKVLHLYEWR